MNTLNQPKFIQAELSTCFVDNHPQLTQSTNNVDTLVIIAHIIDKLAQADQNSQHIEYSSDPYSPWWQPTQIGARTPHKSFYWINDKKYAVCISDITQNNEYIIAINDNTVYEVLIRFSKDNTLALDINGVLYDIQYLNKTNQCIIFINGETRSVNKRPEATTASVNDPANGQLSAPMHGSVLEVCVAAGDTVSQGDKLLILEAMKMEHSFKAPFSGQVTQVNFTSGDSVTEGDELLILEPIA